MKSIKCNPKKSLKMDNNFKDVDFNTPIKDASDIQTCVLKPSLNAFITHKELTQLDVLLTKKGNCSTNDAGTRIAYGDVYNSHALTFYLYNFSALIRPNFFLDPFR